METIKDLLAKNIKRLRLNCQLTQAQLAESAELSLVAVQRSESGRTWPDYATITSLASALNVPADALFLPVVQGESKSPTVKSLMEVIERQEAQIDELKSAPTAQESKSIQSLPKDIYNMLSQLSNEAQYDILRTVFRGMGIQVVETKSHSSSSKKSAG